MTTPPLGDGSFLAPDDRSQERTLVREATEWFTRQAARDYSPEERARFDAWRRQSPAHARAFERVQALWASPELGRAAERLAISADREPPARTWRRASWRLGRAAAVAAGVLLVSLMLWSGDLVTRLQADLVTAVGEQRVVTLPDGSVATLNTDTAVAVQYGPHRRVARVLRGEAAFAVEPDADRPFTVESHGVTATALGTEFLVRERGDEVAVTVLHGSVEVAGGETSTAPPVRLEAGNRVVVGPQGPGPVLRTDAAAGAAWMQGRLVFVRTPLAEVIQELSRYHRGYLAVWNPALRTVSVTGVYHLSDPAHILTTLAETLHFNMVRMTDHLIILR